MSTKRSVWSDAFKRPAKYGALYSQALIVPAGSNLLFTTGMTAFDDDGEIFAPHDAEAQARKIFEVLGQILAEAGATLDDVVKMTVFVADKADIMAIGKARDEVWKEKPPVSSTVQVTLGAPELAVEIEAVAIVP